MKQLLEGIYSDDEKALKIEEENMSSSFNKDIDVNALCMIRYFMLLVQ